MYFYWLSYAFFFLKHWQAALIALVAGGGPDVGYECIADALLLEDRKSPVQVRDTSNSPTLNRANPYLCKDCGLKR